TVLYEMLTGKRAFTGDSSADTMTAILSRDPEALSGNSAIPAALVGIVRRCLEKDPNHRFHSIRDVGFALEAILHGAAPKSAIFALGAESTFQKRPQARRTHWAVAGILISCTIAGFIYYAVSIRSRVPSPSQWEKITNFAEPVSSPSLSPDGRVLTFLRGGT